MGVGGREAFRVNVETMAEIAQPLDQWCDFNCGRLGTITTADDAHLCEDCATQILQAEKQYERDLKLVQTTRVRANGTVVSARAAKAKAKRRAKRKRTKR